MMTFAFVPAMPPRAWAGLFALITVLLAVDLAVWRKRARAAGLATNLASFALWVAVALAFATWVWWERGPELGQQFLAGYLIELSLSVDNLFIFVLVFAQFQISAAHQHRVLFWGIIGAVILRTAFLLAGVGAIARFHWILPLFGVAIIITGVKLALSAVQGGTAHGMAGGLIGLLGEHIPISRAPAGAKFFVTEGGRRLATPLFAALFVIEAADLFFALDSLPAVLAITQDAFIAIASNVFAILGLRSLYLVVSGALQSLRYMKLGLAVLLLFVGAKMLADRWVHLSSACSLAVIATVLAVAVAASLLARRSGQPA